MLRNSFSPSNFYSLKTNQTETAAYFSGISNIYLQPVRVWADVLLAVLWLADSINQGSTIGPKNSLFVWRLVLCCVLVMQTTVSEQLNGICPHWWRSSDSFSYISDELWRFKSEFCRIFTQSSVPGVIRMSLLGDFRSFYSCSPVVVHLSGLLPELPEPGSGRLRATSSL